MSVHNESYNVTVISCFHLVRVSGLASRTPSFAFVYIGYLARCMRPLFLCFFLELINLQLTARDCMSPLTTTTDAHSE
jgi:hypothetical protein